MCLVSYRMFHRNFPDASSAIVTFKNPEYATHAVRNLTWRAFEGWPRIQAISGIMMH